MVILGYRQSSLCNQDLNFQFNVESKFGKPIPEKMIHLLNLKELHPEHISALHFNVTCPLPLSNETLRYYIRGRKCCLRNVKFQLLWKYFGNLTDERHSIYSIKKKLKLRVLKCHTGLMCQAINCDHQIL